MPPREPTPEPTSGTTVFSAASAPQAPSALGEKIAGFAGQLLVPSQLGRSDPSGLPPDLTMPPLLREILEPPLKLLGYRIETQKLEDLSGTEYQCDAVGRGKLRILFLHIAAAILQDSARVKDVAVLLYPLKEGGFTMVRIVSAEAHTVDLAYQQVWTKQSKRFGIDAIYIQWSDIQQLQQRKEPERVKWLQFVLKLDDGPKIPRLADLEKNGGDVKKLAQLLAKRAWDSPDVKSFFRDILKQTALPENWKLEIAGVWTGDAGSDARELIRWLIAKGTNPEKQTCTALASVLSTLLEGNADDRSILYQLIDEYVLITDATVLEDLKKVWPTLS